MIQNFSEIFYVNISYSFIYIHTHTYNRIIFLETRATSQEQQLCNSEKL